MGVECKVCVTKEMAAGHRQAARALGLTVRQFRYYARWAAGMRQVDIAREFFTTPSRVCEVIERARRRNPSLPRPVAQRCGRLVQLMT